MSKMYDFTSDSLTTECQKVPSVRLLCRGNAYREATPPPRPPFIRNCFTGPHWKEPEALLCLAGAECTGDKLKSKTMPQLGPLWHNETTILLSGKEAFLAF